jgi:uncharacterized membrane protein required for colicin V production/uncharacterized protein YkwD
MALDLILGLILVGLVVRGWMRGLAREALGLAVVVAGTVVAFRSSSLVGPWVERISGASPDTARVVAGIAVFLLISIAAGVVSHFVHRGIQALPGLSTVNRVAGAALAAAAYVVVLTVVVSLLAVAPVPHAVADQVDGSVVAGRVTDPTGMAQRMLRLLAGDRVMQVVLQLEELAGVPRIVPAPGETVEIPPAEAADLTVRPDDAAEIFEMLNRERVAAGVDPVVRSAALDEVAQRRAEDMYASGKVARRTDGLRDDLMDLGIPTVARAEVVALAATPASAHEGLHDDESTGPEQVGHDYLKVGVAVVEGPLGLMVVEVLAG